MPASPHLESFLSGRAEHFFRFARETKSVNDRAVAVELGKGFAYLRQCVELKVKQPA